MSVSASHPVSGPLGIGDDGFGRMAWRSGRQLVFAPVSPTGARHAVTIGSTANVNNAAATAPVGAHGTAVVWRSRSGPTLAALSGSGKVLKSARLPGGIDDIGASGSPLVALADGGAIACSATRATVSAIAVSASGRRFSSASVPAPGFVNTQTCAVASAGTQSVLAWIERTADDHAQIEVVRVAAGPRLAAPIAVLPAGEDLGGAEYSVAVTSSGAIAIAWTSVAAGNTGTSRFRWLMPDGSLSPVAPLVAPRKGFNGAMPHVVAVGQDTVMTAYVTPDHRLEARTISAGTGPGAPKVLARDGSGSFSLAATEGRAAIAWMPPDYSTKVTASTWQNGKWAAPSTLARCVPSTHQPCPELNSVAMSHDGRAAVTWSTYSQGGRDRFSSLVSFN